MDGSGVGILDGTAEGAMVVVGILDGMAVVGSFEGNKLS